MTTSSTASTKQISSHGQALTPKLMNRIVHAYKSEVFSVVEIAERFNISQGGLYRVLKLKQVSLRGKTK